MAEGVEGFAERPHSAHPIHAHQRPEAGEELATRPDCLSSLVQDFCLILGRQPLRQPIGDSF